MKIEYGKIYINKTWRFLVPTLKFYKGDFVKKFSALFKLAVGIHDTLLDGSEISENNNLYVLVDKKYNEEAFYDFLDYCEGKTYFIDKYAYEDNVVNSRKYMIVLKIPSKFSHAYACFLRGEYSQMYLDEDLQQLYFNALKNPEKYKSQFINYQILSKTGNIALEKFTSTIKEEFNVDVSTDDFYETEWELPLVKKEEIFNFKENTTIYFNEKIDKKWN